MDKPTKPTSTGTPIGVHNWYEYSQFVARLWRKDLSIRELTANMALGLAGESGELVDLIKKHLYHGKPAPRDKMRSEIGDALYYLQAVANLALLTLEECRDDNVAKLSHRYPKGYFEPVPEGQQDYSTKLDGSELNTGPRELKPPGHSDWEGK